MRALAIDQGTSATKAIVLVDGEVGGRAEVPCAPTAGADGAVEVDPNLLWSSVVTAAREAIVRAGGAIPDAVGLANQGETIVAWDRASGEPCSAGVTWQDRRSADICARLRRDGWGHRLTELTGLELDPYFVAPKVAWLRERVGDEPVITTSDVWLLHRMSGAFVTDASTASRTLLLDLDRVEWSAEASAAFDIDATALPTIVDNAGAVGETAAFTTTPIPVTGLCVDQ